MIDLQEFYILGLPIYTEIGSVKFLLVKEYPEHFLNLQTISMSKLKIKYEYMKLNKDGSLTDFLAELDKLTLFELVSAIPELNESYTKIFDKVFDNQDWINQINEKNFDYYRKLVMTMNCVQEEEINPNPEIQKAMERSKRVKERDREQLSFADIVSSVVGYNGLSYKDINEFTVYQLYMTYYRIAHIKNYDTSTLFATVSTEKVKIESWSKHIDMFTKDKHAISEDEFSRTIGKVFED